MPIELALDAVARNEQKGRGQKRTLIDIYGRKWTGMDASEQSRKPAEYVSNDTDQLSEAQMQALEQACGAERALSPTLALRRLKAPIAALHARGYSLRSIYLGLTKEGLLHCSRSGFFQWVKKNMDLQVSLASHEAKTDREPAPPAKPAQRSNAAVATAAVSHAKQHAPLASSDPESANGRPAKATEGSVSAESNPDAVLHAKRGSERQADKPESGGSSASPQPDIPVLLAKRRDPESDTNGPEERATPAETAVQEGAVAEPVDGANVAPGPNALSTSKSPLSTTQKTSVQSTQGPARMSEEQRRRYMHLLSEQLADMERNTLGKRAERGRALLDQRDKANGGREG